MDLQVKSRKLLGKKVKTLREKGLIPAELYGHEVQNIHLLVDSQDFKTIYREAGENTIVNLIIDEKKEKKPVMIHDVAVHPVTDEVLNIDFYQVRLDEEIRIDVPVLFTGIASAVKDKGGVLVKALQEIEVEALPGNIPHDISVDVSVLKEIGDSIHVSDLVISNKAKILLDKDAVVVTVTEKMTEEEEVEASAEVDLEAVKTESETKSKEEEPKEKDDQAPVQE
jgi:large subunit ribosomal protein L25